MSEAGSNLSETGRLAYFYTIQSSSVLLEKQLRAGAVWEGAYTDRGVQKRRAMSTAQRNATWTYCCCSSAPEKYPPKCFEHLTPLFSYLYLVIGHRIMLWWSTIRDQETLVQSDRALTYDSQGNNLDGGLSAWVLRENVCVVNRETLFVWLSRSSRT